MQDLDDTTALSNDVKHHNYESNQLALMGTIKEIENHYKQGTLAYMESIRRYMLEIDKLRAEIASKKEEMEEEEQRLLSLQGEVQYSEKLLARVNTQFSQKATSLEELNAEYSELVSAKELKKVHQRKESELIQILDEIDQLEMTALKQELERLNLLVELEPKRKKLERLKADLRELELEKKYFESTKLNEIPYMTKQEREDNIVDVVAEEGEIVDEK